MNNIVPFDEAKERQLAAETTALVQQHTGLKVVDEGSYEASAALSLEIARRLKVITEWFKPLKDAAYKLHKDLCAREAKAVEPLKALDAGNAGERTRWRAEQERKRRDEEARLQAIAKQEADALAAAQAAALEASGEAALAEVVLEQAVAAPPPAVVVETYVPKVKGLSTREEWFWRPIGGDRKRAEQLVPREFLTLDDSKLTKYAKAMKADAKVPGIDFYSKDIEAKRTA